MTFAHDHLTCDACEAVTPVTKAEHWETIPGEDGPSRHLCPRCRVLKQRGELATNPLGLRCRRCGRTPVDGISEWRNTPGDEPVCVDCFDEDEDSILI